MIGGWWAVKGRQFARHVAGRVSSAERAALTTWLTPLQLALFESMHAADQRHGLDVVNCLRRAGHRDPDILLAGLLHDSGKGRAVGLWHRVGWSLAQRYGSGVRRVAVRLPGFDEAFRSLDEHAHRSAELALAAGCSTAVAELIRRQDEPTDDPLAQALRLADEAS